MAKTKKSKEAVAKEWMGVLELAAYVGVSKESVYRKIAQKNFPKHRFGKLWKFSKTEIDQYILKR